MSKKSGSFWCWSLFVLWCQNLFWRGVLKGIRIPKSWENCLRCVAISQAQTHFYKNFNFSRVNLWMFTTEVFRVVTKRSKTLTFKISSRNTASMFPISNLVISGIFSLKEMSQSLCLVCWYCLRFLLLCTIIVLNEVSPTLKTIEISKQ